MSRKGCFESKPRFAKPVCCLELVLWLCKEFSNRMHSVTPEGEKESEKYPVKSSGVTKSVQSCKEFQSRNYCNCQSKIKYNKGNRKYMHNHYTLPLGSGW